LEWVKHVDGKSMFPKLEVCLRNHLESWMKNQNSKAAAKSMELEIKRLKELNAAAVAPVESCLTLESGKSDGVAPTGLECADTGAANDDDELGLDGGDVGLDGGSEGGSENLMQLGGESDAEAGLSGLATKVPASNWATVTRVVPISARQPSSLKLAPQRPCMVVAEVQIGQAPVQGKQKRKHKGERGCDSRKRQPRRCKRCVQYGGLHSAVCRGGMGGRSGGQKHCEHFDEQGAAKQASSQI